MLRKVNGYHTFTWFIIINITTHLYIRAPMAVIVTPAHVTLYSLYIMQFWIIYHHLVSCNYASSRSKQAVTKPPTWKLSMRRNQSEGKTSASTFHVLQSFVRGWRSPAEPVESHGTVKIPLWECKSHVCFEAWLFPPLNALFVQLVYARVEFVVITRLKSCRDYNLSKSLCQTDFLHCETYFDSPNVQQQ